MAEGIPQAPLFFELNTGAKMPSIGLGTWQAEPGLVGNAVEIAIRAGYRHIDCARLYCNEQEIGTALKKLFDEGVVKREDVWITSKLWNNDHAPEDVPAALEKTLQDLQLDYVDLYLMHWPFRTLTKPFEDSFNPRNLALTDLPATWKAMEKLYESGKARAIGVSNFSTKKLGDLLGCAQIPPSVVQVECHPVWHQDKLRAFCKQHGIHLSAYSPLGSPGTTGVQVDVLKNPVLIKVSQSLGKTPGQVALRWGLQKGHSVLPKSTKQARINENFDILDWSIPHDLFEEINHIEQSRLIRADFFVHELGPFKSVEEIWDGEI